MSRNSKNAKRLVAARERKGTKGPAITQPKHGKDPKRRAYNTQQRGNMATPRARVVS
jgi:hypothetical protein